VPQFIKRLVTRADAVSRPVTTAIANNAEEPGTSISARERPKVSKRPERRLLDDIFGIVLVPYQPSRQAIGRIEMRQHDLFETLNDGLGRRFTKCVTHDRLEVQ
jgi:hypothetical protein